MYAIFQLTFLMTVCDMSPTQLLVQVTRQANQFFTTATLQHLPHRIISGGVINRCWDESREPVTYMNANLLMRRQCFLPFVRLPAFLTTDFHP